MWRLIVTLLISGIIQGTGWTSYAADVVVATWNMKWFPSGKADLRISFEFEDFKIRKAGEMLTNTIAAVGGSSTNNVIICVQEIRDGFVCQRLGEGMMMPNMKLAAVSDFADKAGVPIWQQCAILSNMPVVEGGAMPWQSERHVDMPRGFVYSIVGGGNELIAVFCVHLKSNLNWSGSELETQKNIYKREFAAAQILAKFHEMESRYGERLKRVVVAGDFNTNEDDDAFVSEATLRSFYGAHFRTCFRGWRKHQRITHPALNGYPDATFDYILYRGFGNGVARKITVGQPISDHNPVCVRLPMSEQKTDLGL